jgi:Protein of unknown function (DUF3489)
MNRHALNSAERITNTMTNAKANTAATVAPQAATVASSKVPSTKEATTPNKPAPQGRKVARPPKKRKGGNKAARARRAKAPGAPRPESKTAKILNLIRRPKGATLLEIMQAVSWQAHSVRGFLSTAGKKHGLKITSSKNPADERVYTAK